MSTEKKEQIKNLKAEIEQKKQELEKLQKEIPVDENAVGDIVDQM